MIYAGLKDALSLYMHVQCVCAVLKTSQRKIYNTHKLNYVHIICKCTIQNFYENKNTDYHYFYKMETFSRVNILKQFLMLKGILKITIVQSINE